VPHTRAVGQHAPPTQVDPPAQVPVGLAELHTGGAHDPLWHDSPDGQHVEPQARSVAQHVPPVQVMPPSQKPFGLDAEHGVTHSPPMHVCDAVQQRSPPHTRAVAQHSPSTQEEPEEQVPFGLLALHSVDMHTHSPKPLPSDSHVSVPVPPPLHVQLRESPGVHAPSSVPEQPASANAKSRTGQASADRMHPPWVLQPNGPRAPGSNFASAPLT
jgi:hypothetical protein